MKNKIIAVIGAGGKTTLIHRLAEEYRRKGASVLVSTTTHMLVEPDTDLSCDSFAIMEKIKKTGKMRSPTLRNSVRSCLPGKFYKNAIIAGTDAS